MRSLAGLLMCLTGMFALQGCAGLAVSESGSSAERESAGVLPVTIRTLNTEHRFTQISTATVAQQLRALHAGESLNILAISGGGSGGAFGAGAVAGLTRSGSRPDFAVVTGVSAGALVAPYAFLGPAWDARLLDAFMSESGDNLRQPRALGAIFGSSFYRGTPLKRLVEAYVSDSMIEAVSREANRGRLLLVATTDVATGQPVVWDLGSIARNGGPSARTLFCDVLVASASVPGMFPPVIIRVHEEGGADEEAHVDGGATVPFFVPPAFVQAPSEASGGAHAAAVYVIIDGPLAEAARTTRLTARGVLTRSIDAGLNHLLLTTLELTAATAQLQGATLRYSAVPAAYPYLDAFDFRAATRRPLFRYAYECAQEGRLWAEIRRTESDEASAGSVAQLPNVPCPSDDPFIGYFALNDRY
jgi:predicted acylesterase/phospholipase RssA